MNEFLKDFRDHWNDSYWWLDHQALRIVLLSVASGIIGLMFLWARLALEARYQPPVPND